MFHVEGHAKGVKPVSKNEIIAKYMKNTNNQAPQPKPVKSQYNNFMKAINSQALKSQQSRNNQNSLVPQSKTQGDSLMVNGKRGPSNQASFQQERSSMNFN